TYSHLSHRRQTLRNDLALGSSRDYEWPASTITAWPGFSKGTISSGSMPDDSFPTRRCRHNGAAGRVGVRHRVYSCCETSAAQKRELTICKLRQSNLQNKGSECTCNAHWSCPTDRRQAGTDFDAFRLRSFENVAGRRGSFTSVPSLERAIQQFNRADRLAKNSQSVQTVSCCQHFVALTLKQCVQRMANTAVVIYKQNS